MGLSFLPILLLFPTLPPPDFARDIRPILAANCLKCHGPDAAARQAHLRLDTRAGITTSNADGEAPVVPGNPRQSLVLERIRSTDPEIRMPPPEVNAAGLAPDQISLLESWITAGAPWSEHWSFSPLVAPALPPVASSWPLVPMDRLVLARLEQEHLTPSPPAPATTLLRRVSLDLIGLPPTLEEQDAFAADTSGQAYEHAVDRLLASPRFGEKWARWWLDLARYADTMGYEKDSRRTMWPYRDWVIRAFNDDLPFDQFTIEQLAGDLLDHPSRDQLVATAFHRNTMTNDEGGTDDEEFRVAAVIDRTNTTMEIWQGLTFACAQCHSHKYDPISQTDYYRLFAAFNNTADADKPGDPPTYPIGNQDLQSRIDTLDAAIARAEARIASALEHIREAPTPAAPATTRADRPFIDDVLPGYVQHYVNDIITHWPWCSPAAAELVGIPGAPPPQSGTRCWRVSGDGASQTFFLNMSQGVPVAQGDDLYTYIYIDPAHPPKAVMLQWTSAQDGWNHRAYWGDASGIPWAKEDEGSVKRKRIGDLPAPGQWVRLSVPASAVGLDNHTITGASFALFGGVTYFDNAGTVSSSETLHPLDTLDAWLAAERARQGSILPNDIKAALLADPPSQEQTRTLAAFYDRNVSPAAARAFAEDEAVLGLASAQRTLLASQTVALPIMRELQGAARRTTHRFNRGSFLNPAEEVSPGAPEFLHPPSIGNRLDLARWLMSADNPLTARALANRIWEQLFGAGLAETVEDLGTQGPWPQQRELLDHLAVTLRSDCAWSLKRFLRIVVTSATYRQSSDVTPALLARDPGNRLLARAPRVRLDGEVIRDSALAAANLLSDHMFGPSVFPAQPDGVWQIIYSNDSWKQSEGQDAHRRSLYTFWRRTSPHPAMTTFDAPSREFCVSRRVRTNTPLQAFVTLNDPEFVEAARALAARACAQPTDDARITLAWRAVLARPPLPSETAEAMRLLASARAEPSASESAAWTRLCAVILNLDEALTRE